jgi:hypothetical protein
MDVGLEGGWMDDWIMDGQLDNGWMHAWVDGCMRNGKVTQAV